MGSEAIIVGLNVVIALAAGWISVRYWRWSWRDREQLRSEPLGALPLSVALLAGATAANAAYYSSARVLGDAGLIDLWMVIPAVVAVRGIVAVSSVLHMLPLWRIDGVAVVQRVVGWTALLLCTWAGVAWWLW